MISPMEGVVAANGCTEDHCCAKDLISCSDLEVDQVAQKAIGSIKRSGDELDLKTSSNQRRARKRSVHSYHQNLTIARTYEKVHSHIQLAAGDYNAYRERVLDHAYRRIQLFFPLLVLYYKEQAMVESERTSCQHGSSDCADCQAAHSAILPNVRDDKGLFSERLHLFHSMNSTVELPTHVNNYDCVIEKHMRPAALEILNVVSNGEMGIFQGLNYFVMRLHQFFNKSRQETQQKLALIREYAALECDLARQERDGAEIREYISNVKMLRQKKRQLQDLRRYSVSVSIRPYTQDREILFSQIEQLKIEELSLKKKQAFQMKLEQSCRSFENLAEIDRSPLIKELDQSLDALHWEAEASVVPPPSSLLPIMIGESEEAAIARLKQEIAFSIYIK